MSLLAISLQQVQLPSWLIERDERTFKSRLTVAEQLDGLVEILQEKPGLSTRDVTTEYERRTSENGVYDKVKRRLGQLRESKRAKSVSVPSGFGPEMMTWYVED